MHMLLTMPNANALMGDWFCTKRASAPATRQSPAPLVFTMLAGMAGRCCVMTLMPAVPRLQTAAPWDPNVNMTCLTPACIQHLSLVKGLCMSMLWNISRYTAATRQQMVHAWCHQFQWRPCNTAGTLTEIVYPASAITALVDGNGHARNAECERASLRNAAAG